MSVERTVLVGYGSHGKDIHEIWRQVHPKHKLVLADHNPAVQDPVLGVYDPRDVEYWHHVLLGAYYPAMRRNTMSGHAIAQPLIHPTAQVGSNCHLESGVVIARNAVLDHSVRVGKHTHINYSASMTRVEMGEYCTISPTVTICGDVKIGNSTFVGAGAVIGNLITIGNNVTIGAGTIVLEDIPDGATVVGNPGRIVHAQAEQVTTGSPERTDSSADY